jgi:hypothetical protein
MIEVSLSSELTDLFNAYYVGVLEVGTTLYYNFDMSSPIISETLYTTDETVIVTDFSGAIESIT